MFRYAGAECPVCRVKFTESDDIVVCPDCGAPHHRECWKQNGHCGCEELHTQGKVWEFVPETEKPAAVSQEPEVTPEEPAEEETPLADGIYHAQEPENEEEEERAEENAEKDEVTCPMCQMKNAAGSRFCNRCGAPLNLQTNLPNGGPVHIIFDPLGGVKPEEELLGAKAKDIAAVVGQNTAYYLPRFKLLHDRRRKVMPNLSPFLFDFPWFFYRKMPLQGTAVLLIQIALLLPQVWHLFINDSSAVLETAYHVCFYLSYVVRILSGLFANRLYLSHCAQKALALRGRFPEEEEFRKEVKRRGGVFRPAITVFAILYGIAYLVYTMILFRL